jgi:outer membrane murein-binding lipoprotein Lpp
MKSKKERNSMKKQLFSLMVVAGCLSFTKPVLADDSSAQNTEKMIQKMTVQAHALESQMHQLNSQIHALKVEQQTLKSQVKTEKADAHQSMHAPETTPFYPIPSVLSGSPVMVASYLGSHTTFSPFDLAVTYTDYMENLRILQLREALYNRYKRHNVEGPSGPMLIVSGKVEGQGIYSSTFNSSHTSRIDLSAAELDLIPVVNSWAGGFVSFKYDNSQAPNQPLTNNSRVHVDQGYLTFGNLNRLPFYLTIGQFYVPFGNYSSLMISSPMTQQIFQTRARALEIAYQHPCDQGPYAQVYAFNGDTNTKNNDNINNLGANVGFSYSHGDAWNIDSSVGVIANVADSLGMQQTNLPTGFAGFSVGNNEALARQVAGVAAHVNFGVGHFGMNTEFATAASQFAPQDLMYNGHGARPAAMNLEGYYNFRAWNRPSAVVASYGQSWQALALGAPQYRYEASVLTSVWRNTLQQIEFRHDVNYSGTDSSNGRGAVAPTVGGGSSNTVTLLLGIYF